MELKIKWHFIKCRGGWQHMAIH